MAPEKLQSLTLYLPESEVKALERESREEGRSGVSAQIRWILYARRNGSVTTSTMPRHRV